MEKIARGVAFIFTAGIFACAMLFCFLVIYIVLSGLWEIAF